MNQFQQSARVGLFFLLGVALVWVSFETLSDGHLFKDKGYTIIAGFESLKELKDGDEVRMAGVKIGAVDKTRLAGSSRRAEAILRIDKDVKVAGDATATILSAGLIGTNYIGIDLGSATAAPLADGAEIRTTTTADMNTIMAELGKLGEKLEGALGSFGTAFNGDASKPGLFQKLDTLVTTNSAKIDTAMSNLQQVSDKLNRGEGTLGKLINDPKLHDELLATVTEIKAAAADAKVFVSNAQQIVGEVKAGRGALGALVYDETTANNLKSTVANIREVSDKLAKGEGTLGKLIKDDTLYTGVQNTMRKADRALDGLGDSGPISAVGVVAQSLF